LTSWDGPNIRWAGGRYPSLFIWETPTNEGLKMDNFQVDKDCDAL
jgi:hypothetical protein